MNPPETRYAKSGDVHIAYQVIGNGPIDLVFVPGYISNLEVHWDDPGFSHLLFRLAGFSRVITFDKRGTGLSDPVSELPNLEQRMDDVRAVMDAVGSKRAALLGASEGGPMSILFAATYPKRTRALVLYGSYAHFHSWVLPPQRLEGFVARITQSWGTGESASAFAPEAAKTQRFHDWWARYERLGASPAAAVALARMNAAIDVRPVLSAIRVPTLVIHRRDDARVNFAGGRYLAEHIAGARFVELPGRDHPIWTGDCDAVIDQIEEFLTGIKPRPDHDRVLATIVAIDIADAARHAAFNGDQKWLDLVQRYRAHVEAEVGRHRGHAIGMRPDGTIASFDGPARAVRFAIAVRAAAAQLGLTLRCGVHTGEIEMQGSEVGGLALHVAMRIATEARPGEILTSATVRDLVAGSDLRFGETHAKAIDGIADPLRMQTVEAGAPPTPVPARPAPRISAEAKRLSPREREILQFVARGLTNPEIAAALELSEHTVKRHVANILTKLHLSTRSAAATFAAQHGLA